MTQGPLPLILLSARDHPNKEFREKLWLNLEIWLQEKIPIFCEIDAQKLIKSHKGTFLEPFYLSSSDMKLASFLLRLALSKEVNASRFRVVSSVTIETKEAQCSHEVESRFTLSALHSVITHFTTLKQNFLRLA